MEYVVPLVILLVIVLVVVVGSRLLGRRSRSLPAATDEVRPEEVRPEEVRTAARAPARKHPDRSSAAKEPGRKGARFGREITRENAEEAGALLSPEAHQRVYSLIAQHQVLNAVQAYRKATRLGLGESAAAVAALAQFPQPSPEPVMPVVPEGPLTVDDIVNAAPEAGKVDPKAGVKPASVPGAYRYRAIVARGEDVREVASTRLNEESFARIRDLARSGNYDAAARLLRDHADIGETEAQEFVAMIGPED
ncbi:hypothetical protein AAFM46_14390 [Arthrobacter sp. TMP15]|uniref:hypothetical protein n=1 Tax=Arthrobacter sp. TMP15 TaxID=3140789 RepID=UPI0031BA4FDF